MTLNISTTPMLFCMQAVESLDKHKAAPMNVMEDPAVVKRLLQSDNAGNWNTLSSIDVPGKPLNSSSETANGVKVYMSYTKPYCAGGSSSCATNVCDATGATTDDEGFLELLVDQCAERHFVVSNSEFNLLCKGPSERIASTMRRKAYEILKEINSAAIAELYAIINPYNDGQTGKGDQTKVCTVINQDGNIVPAGLVKIAKEYLLNGYSGNKLIFGGTALAEYFLTKMYQGGGANMTGKEDFFANSPFVFDPTFDSVFQTLESDTNSHGISIPTGGLGIIEHYRNTGENKVMLGNRVATTMKIDGIDFDYDMYFDECALTWKIQLKKRYGFASIPKEAYCDEKGLVYHWLFDCGTFDCSKL